MSGGGVADRQLQLHVAARDRATRRKEGRRHPPSWLASRWQRSRHGDVQRPRARVARRQTASRAQAAAIIRRSGWWRAMIHVRRPTPADKPAWLRMRRALWPEDGDSHSTEIDQFFAGTIRMLDEVLLAVTESGEVVGF